MPPHCDTMDGPVVKAAQKALEAKDVNLILPWVYKMGEDEMRVAFLKTQEVRKLGGKAQELADRWFYETAVRLHRQGEGAPYTGLKPGGLDEGPVVPKAERAIQEGSPRVVIDFLSDALRESLERKFSLLTHLKDYDIHDVDAAREYIEAMLDFIVYSHEVHQFIHQGLSRRDKGGFLHGH